METTVVPTMSLLETVEPEVRADVTSYPTIAPMPTVARPTLLPLPTTIEEPPLPTPLLPSMWTAFSLSGAGVEMSAPVSWERSLEVKELENGEALLLVESMDTATYLQEGGEWLGGTAGFFIVFDGTEMAERLRLGEDMPAERLLAEIIQQSSAVAAEDVRSFTLQTYEGAMVQLLGDLTGELKGLSPDVSTRVMLLLEPVRQRPLLFLWGTLPQNQATYDPLFTRIISSISLQAVPPIGITGDLGERGNGTHTLNAGVIDTWLFDGVAGQYATVGVRSTNSLDFVLTVIAPSGATVAMVDRGYAGDPELLFDELLAESGQYQVQVQDFFNGSGKYNISINQQAQPQYGGGGELITGQVVNGYLRGQDDVWTFQATVDEVISLVLAPESLQLDLFFEVWAPNGERVVALDESYSGDPEILSGYTISMTGVYRVVVNSFSNKEGAYTLALDRGGETASNFYEAGDLLYGDVVTEELRVNEVHAWYFRGGRGQSVELLVEPANADSGSLDLDMWLLSPNLERLVMQDEMPFGGQERIVYSLRETGDYVVIIRDFYGVPGYYRLSLDSDNYWQIEGVATMDEWFSGELEPGYGDAWRWLGQVGQQLIITVKPSGNENVAFWIVDPQGRRRRNIAGRPAGEAEYTHGFVIDEAGEWLIVVRNELETGGGYQLLVED
ncbi:MAG TPA: hypothetical protein VLL52_17965 [Anaerolineae bacterium]|nr:hypothetical protein [Anaerolineae bacterium]